MDESHLMQLFMQGEQTPSAGFWKKPSPQLFMQVSSYPDTSFLKKVGAQVVHLVVLVQTLQLVKQVPHLLMAGATPGIK